MQILEHGREQAQTLLFFPCTAEPVWAFAETIALLSRNWHVFQVIFDGHQPEYPGDFTSVEQTVDDVTAYLKAHGVTRLDAAYGCSLGGACLTRLLALGELPVRRAIIFYEASDHRLDGEALLEIKRRATERLKFLGALVNGNRTNWAYRLFEKTYVNYSRMVKEHQARGEWRDAWRVELNPDHRTEGFCFHLIGCPIAKHAREHGYEVLLPYLCKTDHYLAEVMHTRLIRTQTEALGGEYCGYFITGNKE